MAAPPKPWQIAGSSSSAMGVADTFQSPLSNSVTYNSTSSRDLEHKRSNSKHVNPGSNLSKHANKTAVISHTLNPLKCAIEQNPLHLLIPLCNLSFDFTEEKNLVIDPSSNFITTPRSGYSTLGTSAVVPSSSAASSSSISDDYSSQQSNLQSNSALPPNLSSSRSAISQTLAPSYQSNQYMAYGGREFGGYNSYGGYVSVHSLVIYSGMQKEGPPYECMLYVICGPSFCISLYIYATQ